MPPVQRRVDENAETILKNLHNIHRRFPYNGLSSDGLKYLISIVNATNNKYHHSNQSLASKLDLLKPTVGDHNFSTRFSNSPTTTISESIQTTPSVLKETMQFQECHKAQFGRPIKRSVNELLRFDNSAKRVVLRDHNDNVTPKVGQFVLLENSYAGDPDAAFGVGRVYACDPSTNMTDTLSSEVELSATGLVFTHEEKLPESITVTWYDNLPNRQLCHGLVPILKKNLRTKRNERVHEVISLSDAICWGFDLTTEKTLPMFVWRYLFERRGINPMRLYPNAPHRFRIENFTESTSDGKRKQSSINNNKDSCNANSSSCSSSRSSFSTTSGSSSSSSTRSSSNNHRRFVNIACNADYVAAGSKRQRL